MAEKKTDSKNTPSGFFEFRTSRDGRTSYCRISIKTDDLRQLVKEHEKDEWVNFGCFETKKLSQYADVAKHQAINGQQTFVQSAQQNVPAQSPAPAPAVDPALVTAIAQQLKSQLGLK